MEDLISIIVLILYFVAVSASKKNKKKKKADKKIARKRSVDFEQAFEHVIDTISSEIGEKAAQSAPAQATQIGLKQEHEGEDPCHKAMLPPQQLSMHMKNVSQAEMRDAGEVFDPCHDSDIAASVAFEEDSPVYRSPIFDTEDKEAFAQDVLRGVIMSEVLSRPNSNRLRAGMKRGA